MYNRPQVHNPMYPKTRKLVDMPKLLAKYGVHEVNIPYKVGDKYDTLKIPVNVDLFIKLKVWISYDIQTHELYVSKEIRGGGNYWITQLVDDVKNGRIDLEGYVYA